MKKNSWLMAFCLLLSIFSFSCSGVGSHNFKYKVSDSGKYFTIMAKYDKDQSESVDGFMNRYFNRHNNISFTHTIIDGNLTLDDGTRFYIKKQPGYLSIKFNKEENSPAALRQIKLFGERIKTVMQH